MIRLTLEQAEFVRNEAARGVSDSVLAARLDVSERVVRDCRLGYYYKKAGGPITKITSRISDSEIRRMREMAGDPSVPFAAIADEFDVSVSYVSLIARGLRRHSAGGIISEPRNKHFAYLSKI